MNNKALARNVLLVSSLWWFHVESFSITAKGKRLGSIHSHTFSFNNPKIQRPQRGKLHMSSFESDFASAMPEKPKLTYEEQMVESATTFIADLESRLKEGVAPPPELEELRQARDAGADASELAAKIYILLIEQGMLYDQDPDDGSLSPTNFDIK
eukprot:CAMPEP_0176503886 /NCGR_PEP_ID=MMETSP0200_2-20121128/15626_1 /TAXON_ID=947934 /ORGANISM="Chaetoceros sp., Strain GSL56" /LENGTH=154 /DNA_ID=CAMNT_0017903255 /DNA_START=17 /DNA_END=481 /DNA_ORIENTATION=-